MLKFNVASAGRLTGTEPQSRGQLSLHNSVVIVCSTSTVEHLSHKPELYLYCKFEAATSTGVTAFILACFRV